MENSIAAIIEIDKKAREKSDAAAKKAEEILAAARAEKESLSKEIVKKAAEQTGKQFAELKEAAEKEIAEINAEADKKCRELDDKMEAGKDGFRGEIVGRILTIG